MTSLTAVLELLLTPSPTVITAGLIIVLFLPVLLHFVLAATTPYTTLPSILLLGPSNAGKTSLAALIERGPDAGRANAVPETHTSQVPLIIELSTARGRGYKDALASKETVSEGSGENTKKFHLVDVPGHPKLRSLAMDRLVPPAMESAKVRGIMFLVDAAGLMDREVLSETAEYLYAVLMSLQRRSTAAKKVSSVVPVLVAANKLDLFTALPAATVKKELEAEITRIRASRSKGLLDSGVGVEDVGSEEQDMWLGEYGSKGGFEFGQMEEYGVEVQVLPGSVRGDKGAWKGVDTWWAWMAEVL